MITICTVSQPLHWQPYVDLEPLHDSDLYYYLKNKGSKLYNIVRQELFL